MDRTTNQPEPPRPDPRTPGPLPPFPDARWAAQITAEVRAVAEQLRQLEQTLLRTLQDLADQQDRHLAYHRDHEHQWGLLRLIQRHPARTLTLALLLGAAALGRATIEPAVLERLLLAIGAIPP
jgi:hypothetical protein